jgi:hypothetical protein
MDLQLVARVLWRFRILILVGFALALALSFLAMIRLDTSGGGMRFAYRDSEQWDSTSTLFVTARKFPWGSVLRPDEQPLIQRPENTPATDGAATDETPVAGIDSAHLTALAGLYARLATSDPVLQLTTRGGPLNGLIQAEPLAAGKNNSGDPLPMIGLSAISTSPAAAHDLARRHVAAFIAFLEQRQARARIPLDERVVVEVTQHPQPPVLLQPRKKTRPVIVFLAVMVAVIGLAFVLENLRPRVRPLPSEEVPQRRVSRSRRSRSA